MKRTKIVRNLLVVAYAMAGVALVSPMPGAAQTAQAANNATPSPLQIAQGAKAWSENCGRCHNFRDPKEFSDKNWDVIVTHMRTIAPLPGQAAREIKAFLKASN